MTSVSVLRTLQVKLHSPSPPVPVVPVIPHASGIDHPKTTSWIKASDDSSDPWRPGTRRRVNRDTNWDFWGLSWAPWFWPKKKGVSTWICFFLSRKKEAANYRKRNGKKEESVRHGTDSPELPSSLGNKKHPRKRWKTHHLSHLSMFWEQQEVVHLH